MSRIFTIPGEVKGKGRPRFARAGKFVKAYTPKETANYENLVKISYQQEHAGKPLFENALNLDVTVFTSIPKSFSKKKTELALSKELLPTKKPDLDNIAKIIADSLNGIAYQDDKQITSLTIKKFYGQAPQAVVKINELSS